MRDKKIILLIIVFVLSVLISVNLSGVDKTLHTEIVDSLEDLPAPIQIATTGEADVIISGEETHLTFVAEYTIVGRVITTSDYVYDPTNARNTISPKDVGIVWGLLSNKEVDSKISWFVGHRTNWFTVSDLDWYYNREGGPRAIQSLISNNHLIHSSNHIRKLIQSISVGDYVKIEGYLVDAKYRTGYTKTSIFREDRGPENCETIYVTNVTWLKTR